jgi:hypothetical protein
MAAVLMAKLLEIERSVGYVDPLAIRRMAMDAQTMLLDLQKQYADGLSAKTSGVTERMERIAQRSRPLLMWPEVSHQLQPQTVNRGAAPAPEPRGVTEEVLLAKG